MHLSPWLAVLLWGPAFVAGLFFLAVELVDWLSPRADRKARTTPLRK